MNEQLSRVERCKQKKTKGNSYLDWLSPDRKRKARQKDNIHLQAEDEIVSMEQLPSRKEIFPSQRLKMTKIFYNSLLYIFVAIMGVLLWWAVKESPWGKTQGF